MKLDDAKTFEHTGVNSIKSIDMFVCIDCSLILLPNTTKAWLHYKHSEWLTLAVITGTQLTCSSCLSLNKQTQHHFQAVYSATIARMIILSHTLKPPNVTIQITFKSNYWMLTIAAELNNIAQMLYCRPSSINNCWTANALKHGIGEHSESALYVNSILWFNINIITYEKLEHFMHIFHCPAFQNVCDIKNLYIILSPVLVYSWTLTNSGQHYQLIYMSTSLRMVLCRAVHSGQ